MKPSIQLESKVKDLILTYATDIGYANLRRLIVSARRFCSPEAVDIIVIINPMGNCFAELADEYHVQLVPCSSVWKEIGPYPLLRSFYRLILVCASFMAKYPQLFGSADVCSHIHRTIAGPWLHASCQRYTIIQAILQVRTTYRMVLLTDARDVIFQANPFQFLDEDKLHVFLQHNVIYGDDNLDTVWARSVLGASVANRLTGKAASCCGTTFGGRQILLAYVDAMISTILKYKFSVVDQVPHNMIAYFGLPSTHVVFHSNEDGAVLTLGGMNLEQVELTSTDLRIRGRVVPVVHMYDRIREINEFFCTLYP